MKKIISVILIILTLTCSLTACASNKNDKDNNESATSTPSIESLGIDSEFNELNSKLSIEDKKYYGTKKNEKYELDDYKNDKDDMKKFSKITVSEIQNKHNKVDEIKNQVFIDEITGEEYQVESIYTHIVDGTFDNFSGEYCYIIDEENNINLKEFVVPIKIHLQPNNQEFVFSDEDNKKNEEAIEEIMKSIKNFKNTNTIQGFTYIKTTFETQQTIELPSLQSIKQDIHKLIKLEDDIYDMILMFPTPDFLAKYTITFTEEGLITVVITTENYV